MEMFTEISSLVLDVAFPYVVLYTWPKMLNDWPGVQPAPNSGWPELTSEKNTRPRITTKPTKKNPLLPFIYRHFCFLRVFKFFFIAVAEAYLSERRKKYKNRRKSHLPMAFGALTALAKKLGEFNSQVMLSVVYVLGVGLTSALAKLFRKKFLPLDQKTQSSYWIEHKEEGSMKSFKRSF
jgi:hypothetical protein